MIGKKRIFKFIVLALTTLLMNSCSTNAYIAYDYDYPILDIQSALAENLPEGLGATNTNRRVFYSKKFTVKQDKKSRVPLIMRVVINGDRRPYSLEVEVRRVSPDITNIEEAFNFGDDFRGQDSLAKRVVTRVQEQLVQRRKNKNIFDDFKPF